MNSHLNIFKTYSKDNREYQLENDLTRAFAICLQEDNLFMHEILKYLLKDSNHYNQLFEDLEGNAKISIEIQRPVKSLGDFLHIYAVSLSENIMLEPDFWSQNHHHKYDPICDVVIRVDEILILFEAKRSNIDCTAQLYNQCYNLCISNGIPIEELKNYITPVDLSWPRLMEMAVKIFSFEKATHANIRILSDFIQLIRGHNFRWLPEATISSISSDNRLAILRRIETAVHELCKNEGYLQISDRLGIFFQKPWAQEILFSVSGNGDLVINIYPGNTKAQGSFIFQNDPKFSHEIEILGSKYNVDVQYHIKLTSFRRFFTGLDFDDNSLREKLYTKENFWKFTGRKHHGEAWDELEALFDQVFVPEFNWREKCHWNEKVKNTKKTMFDISFGYGITLAIPFKTLQALDQKKTDLSNLVDLLKNIYSAFDNKLIS